MKVHEYQAKEILRSRGVPVPRGQACFTVDEAVAAATELGGTRWVVKAQIHAGGRGKGGGVKVVDSLEEVRQAAEDMLGMMLITHQTSPEGQRVNRLLVEEGAEIARELYVGLVIDRSSQRVVVMVSSEGGTEIEEVAATNPGKIFKKFVDPKVGLTEAEAKVRLGGDIRILRWPFAENETGYAPTRSRSASGKRGFWQMACDELSTCADDPTHRPNRQRGMP